jgi:hypothetical protein
VAVDKNGDNPDEAADRGEFRAADEAKKMGPPSSAPVGHSLLIDGSNYCCFVVLPFM